MKNKKRAGVTFIEEDTLQRRQNKPNDSYDCCGKSKWQEFTEKGRFNLKIQFGESNVED